jgi:general secretion pathway protein A
VYERFYRFSGLPFLLTPDPRFYFGSSVHTRAISHLIYGLSQEEGFIVITGEVGAGKTTLVEHLWSQLDRESYIIARVVTTLVSGDDLVRLAMAGFGLDDSQGANKATLLRRFEQWVHGQRQHGRRCLLVVDEAQNLPLAALEELRMLSNITVEGRASVQTILLGQPQFRATLAGSAMEQLRQRVLASYHLGPLSETETRQYIEHRLRMVGWQGDPAWEDAAFASVHRHTGGLPRRINTLCSRVLLLGALEEVHAITAAMVDTTAGELEHDLGVTHPASAPRTPHDATLADLLDDDRDALTQRIEALERRLDRQDRLFHRLLDRLGSRT